MNIEAAATGRSGAPSVSDKEAVFLRRLCDHYYGTFLLRHLDGIIHNLNGPLQSLYIRCEQLEQNLRRLQNILESNKAGEARKLASNMEVKTKAIAENLDHLGAQVRFLSNEFLTEKHSGPTEVDVNDVIKSCIYVLRADMFFKHQVEKVLKLGGGLPPVAAAKTDLSVIVLSLVDNALDAMVDAEKKRLIIETAGRDAEVTIRVEDSGCGIAEQHIQEIYNPFFTTKKTGENRHRGKEHAGFGLSIVSLLLKDCHGTIVCHSRPGNTTFTARIPAAANTAFAAPVSG